MTRHSQVRYQLANGVQAAPLVPVARSLVVLRELLANPSVVLVQGRTSPNQPFYTLRDER